VTPEGAPERSQRVLVIDDEEQISSLEPIVLEQKDSCYVSRQLERLVELRTGVTH